MNILQTPSVRFCMYYVLFRKSRLQEWWARWFTKWHCSVIEDVGDYCIHTETCFGLTVQEIHCKTALDVATEYAATGRILTVVVVEVEKKYRTRYIPFGLFTCVTIVKSLLGLYDWRVQTPYRLLKYLESHGASVVRSDDYE